MLKVPTVSVSERSCQSLWFDKTMQPSNGAKRINLSSRLCFLRLFLLTLLLSVLSSLSFAQDGGLEVTKFPEAVLADGLSNVTISIKVFDKSGRIVRDGTEVIVETTLGTFQESVLRTQNGLVTATFTAGQISGTARVTVSVLSLRTTQVIEIPLLKDRESLRASRVFIEVTAPVRVTYAPETRMLQASGPGKQVQLRVKDITILAEELQYSVLDWTVIAKKVTVKSEILNQDFIELKLNLKDLSGIGLTKITERRPRIVAKHPFIDVQFEERERVGLVKIQLGKLEPLRTEINADTFVFEDLELIPTLIYARKATIYPGKEVVFQQATVDIQGTKVLRVPLFRTSTETVRPVISEEFVNVSNNRINVDFPYYLGIRPGGSSLLRLRWGINSGRGVGAGGGMFLDYENGWTLGKEDNQGYFTFGGIGRKDWGLSLRQSLRFGGATNAYFQADFPSNRAINGTASIDTRLSKNVRANFYTNVSRSVKGFKTSSFNQSISIRQNPVRIKNTSFTYSPGVAFNSRQFSSGGFSAFSDGVGLELNLGANPRRIGNGFLNFSARGAQLTGRNVKQGLSSSATLRYDAAFSDQASYGLSYDFADDRFSSAAIGKHRVGATFLYNKGRTSISSFMSKAIGLDRSSLQADLSYGLSGLYRIGATSTLESFRGSRYTDYSVVLAYRVGYREIGLSWSRRTNRIGIEILGSSLR